MAWIPHALHFLATFIREPLQYSFMVHAILAGIIVGVLDREEEAAAPDREEGDVVLWAGFGMEGSSIAPLAEVGK